MSSFFSQIRRDSVDKFRLTPENTCLESLSPREIDALFEKSREDIQSMLKRCVLAVLISGEETDDVKSVLQRHRGFSVEVIKTAGGIELLLKNAPLNAFVIYEQQVGKEIVNVPKLVEGLRQHVFAVIRDLLFITSEIDRTQKFDLTSPDGITDAVFLMLRNAGVFQKTGRHKVVVCFGGHAISKEEYEYTKQVGYECGIRFMDVVTGCGPGAMKGPMEGAAIAHAKQRVKDGRYIGITEPGIIASEAPNAIVDPLVIMPDIEKRLEAFVRLGHGIVVFPGGVGTAEELMYILGILAHPENRELPFPLILSGPASSRVFFENLDRFVRATLGEQAASHYQIIIDDPERTAKEMNKGMLEVKTSRENLLNAYYFNRSLHIPSIFQEGFVPSHSSAAALDIRRSDTSYLFAASLRRFFSSVVWGNVKPDGIAAVERHGPLRVSGDSDVLAKVDELVRAFAADGRMRLVGEYVPVYRVVY
jgi:pyrimidine/purine-5'-nucleotide nucleosidase